MKIDKLDNLLNFELNIEQVRALPNDKIWKYE